MPINQLLYPLDTTGILPSNLITNEQQILTAANGDNFHIAVPELGPYFADSLIVTITAIDGTTRTLTRGIDFIPTHWFISASRACALPIYGSITFLDRTLSGIIKINYQTVGGTWTVDNNVIAQILSDALRNPRIISWEEVTAYPVAFPPIPHEWNLTDMVGMTEVVLGIKGVENAILQQITTIAAIESRLNTTIGAEVAIVLSSLASETSARIAEDYLLQQAIVMSTNAGIDNIWIELDATQVGAGLNPDGTFTAPLNTVNLGLAVSLKDGLVKLDDALAVESAARTTLATGLANEVQNRVSADTILTNSISLIEQSISVLNLDINTLNNNISTATLTTVATTANQVIDTALISSYRTLKYIIQVESGTVYQASEIILIHNGVSVYVTEYGIINTAGTLATFDADISGGTIRLLVTPVNAATKFNVFRIAINI